MRLSLTTLLLLFTVVLINAQGIQFFEGDLAALKQKAKEENKVIFVDAFTTWCGPCKWMAANSFPDENVGKYFNENLISYQLDMEKGEGLDFAKKYDVRAYPTLIFIDAEGDLVHKAVGALNPEQLLQTGKDALDPNANIGGLIDRYEAGERDMDFIRTYLTKSSRAMMDVKEAADWYFYFQDEKDLMTKENVELILGIVNNTNNKGFQFLLKNQDECQKLTDYPIDQYIEQTFLQSLANAKQKGEGAYSAAVSDLKKSGYKDAEKLLARVEFVSLLRAEDKDWQLITRKIDRYFNKFAPNDAQMRNQMAWSYYTNDAIQDKKLLTMALNWAKKSVELDEGYANTDTYAALLYKLGMKKEAAEAAKKAIQLAKKSGEDASETEALLEKINKL